MKHLMIRLLLFFVGVGLLVIYGFPLLSFKPPENVQAYEPRNSELLVPNADFHLWTINEIFSCADGSVQFVELVTNFGGQHRLDGHQLSASNLAGTQTNTFMFPNDLSSSSTAGHSLLIATPGFASLAGGVTPDFTIPTGFLFTKGGSVNFASVNSLSYGAGELPLDGVTSLGPAGTTSINSPKNFAGQEDSVSCPNPNLAISKQAPATIKPFSLISFTLTVTSSGTVSNTNVVLTDTIPISTSFVSATVTPVNGVLTWMLGDMLPPLSVINRTFVVSSSAPTGTTVVNSDYGVGSDQTSATGLEVEVQVTASNNFVYLPVILKNFSGFVGDHDEDLNFSSP